MKNREEISTFIAKEIKEMGLNDSFNEEMMEEIKKTIFEKIAQENKLIEQNDIENKEVAIIEPEEQSVIVTKTTPETTYVPELPSFIDKIEPEKFIIFDRNELSVGGENLSNRPFRLVSDPDKKKSIHDTWMEDGKKRGEVYIAKLIKIGEIEFDYTNGLSQYIESVQEEPNTNNFGFQIEPFEEDVPVQIIDDESNSNVPKIDNTELELKIKNYVKELLGGKQDISSVPVNESTKNSTNIKIREIFTNDNQYKKIDTPQEIKESIKNGSGKAILKSKNEEVQIWVLEGKEYFLPVNIISDTKCHILKNKTI